MTKPTSTFKGNIVKANTALQIAVLITIPLSSTALNNILISLWAVTVLVLPNRETSRQNSMHQFWPFVIYFLVIFSPLFYTDNLTLMDALKYLENKFTLILLPALMVFSYPVDLKRAMELFVAMLCVLCCIALIIAILNNIDYNNTHALSSFHVNPWFFAYILFSYNVGLHPTYFSLFILVGMTFLLTWPGKMIAGKVKWIIVAFLVLNILLLLSRLMILLTFCLIFVYILFGLRVSNIMKIVFIGLCFLMSSLGLLHPVAQKRFTSILEGQEATYSGFNLKFKMWKALYDDVISENMIFGIGPINQEEYINGIYKKHGITPAYTHSYNSHNQYIDNMLYYGIIGVCTLLFLYMYYLVKGIQEKNTLLVAVIIIFAVGSLMESLLARHKGMIFFNFVVPFTLLNWKHLTNNHKYKTPVNKD